MASLCRGELMMSLMIVVGKDFVELIVAERQSAICSMVFGVAREAGLPGPRCRLMAVRRR
jgi:hypothetical protein